MSTASASLLAITLVVIATIAIGSYGVRLARTTSDFLVASRTVRPGWNAAAISGEYLSAASFLGVAGLVALYGPDALWYPVGFTAGYLALLLFVAAPLRRSGAFTLPDFTEIRWRSVRLRRLATVMVLVIVWLYLVPQLHGAGLVLLGVTGLPRWVGIIVVGSVVAINVVAGGMRSITFVQAFQYWFKLLAIALPVLVVLGVARPDFGPVFSSEWALPGRGLGGGAPAPELYSLVLATFLGTMGLPHVLVRFYTNVDGPAARRTTVKVLALLGAFYLFPGLAGLLAHMYVGTPQPGASDASLLLLPTAALAGPLGVMLAALVSAGAIAAFLSTSSGLVVAAAGVLSTDLLPGRVRDFRIASVAAVVVPVGLALGTTTVDISQVVGMAFAVAASTFCPLLVLGIWWRGLTAAGAVAGLVVGGGVALGAVVAAIATRGDPPRLAWLLAQPAAVSVPLAFATMIGVSLVTRRRIPAGVDSVLARFHLPAGARQRAARPEGGT